MVLYISRYRRFQARDRVLGGFVNICFRCFQIICNRRLRVWKQLVQKRLL